MTSWKSYLDQLKTRVVRYGNVPDVVQATVVTSGILFTAAVTLNRLRKLQNLIGRQSVRRQQTLQALAGNLDTNLAKIENVELGSSFRDSLMKSERSANAALNQAASFFSSLAGLTQTMLGVAIHDCERQLGEAVRDIRNKAASRKMVRVAEELADMVPVWDKINKATKVALIIIQPEESQALDMMHQWHATEDRCRGILLDCLVNISLVRLKIAHLRGVQRGKKLAPPTIDHAAIAAHRTLDGVLTMLVNRMQRISAGTHLPEFGPHET